MSLGHFLFLFLTLFATYATGQGRRVSYRASTGGDVVPCPGDGEYRLDYDSILFNNSEFLIYSMPN